MIADSVEDAGGGGDRLDLVLSGDWLRHVLCVHFTQPPDTKDGGDWRMKKHNVPPNLLHLIHHFSVFRYGITISEMFGCTYTESAVTSTLCL